MPELTVEYVRAAYAALGSGDRAKVAEYWDENIRWNTPGTHQYAGWHEGLDVFLAFLGKVGEVSGGTWDSATSLIFVDPVAGYSADVSRTTATRTGSAAGPGGARSLFDALDLEGVHLLKWVDGRIVEGRGAMFEGGQANFDLWWSPLTAGHRRVAQ